VDLVVGVDHHQRVSSAKFRSTKLVHWFLRTAGLGAVVLFVAGLRATLQLGPLYFSLACQFLLDPDPVSFGKSRYVMSGQFVSPVVFVGLVGQIGLGS